MFHIVLKDINCDLSSWLSHILGVVTTMPRFLSLLKWNPWSWRSLQKVLKARDEESQEFSMRALSGGYSLRTKDNLPGLPSSDLWDGTWAQTRLSGAGSELPWGLREGMNWLIFGCVLHKSEGVTGPELAPKGAHVPLCEPSWRSEQRYTAKVLWLPTI